MILNLLRVQDFKVEDMIKRSFSEFSSQKLLPQQEEFLSKAQVFNSSIYLILFLEQLGET